AGEEPAQPLATGGRVRGQRLAALLPLGAFLLALPLLLHLLLGRLARGGLSDVVTVAAVVGADVVEASVVGPAGGVDDDGMAGAVRVFLGADVEAGELASAPSGLGCAGPV